MKVLFTIIFLSLIRPALAQTFIIHAPNDLQTTSVTLNDPDDAVASLGAVSIRVDFSATHDTLFELTVRRQGLTLADGRPVTRFGYSIDDNLIVGSTAPVDHISIAGIETDGSTRKALVLFHNAKNEIIAPHKEDIAAFDLSYNRRSINYQPLLGPTNVDIPVNILLDSSGSMGGFMSHAMNATREFMGKLPEFTRCQVMTFNSRITHLTPKSTNALTNCPDTRHILNRPITPSGSTALMEALGEGFQGNSIQRQTAASTIPKLVIVLTDGVNTNTSPYSQSQLLTLKRENNVRTFVFWIGNYNAGHLTGLADLEVISSQDVIKELDNFFHSIGISVSGMQTLTLL